ncbi:MAG: diphosphomevalonate decarboxylase [Anaerolineaceae bacterium]|nr:diphosphomevalonate decarboxylase [Anaerolineaceae bacterium]
MEDDNLTATAVACANIAFIKYWGDRDAGLRLPANGSISMNLDGLTAHTRVDFDKTLTQDSLSLNGEQASGPALSRVIQFLDLVRDAAGKNLHTAVESENNFPTQAGIASSAAAFAALSLAASHALGLDLTEAELSRLARRGSGSACRSIPGGFVEWQAGTGDLDSYAFSIAQPDYWDLVDCIAIVETSPKKTGSSEGHALAASSPIQYARLADARRRLDICRKAILERDFTAMASICELDSNLMHAVMMTSSPALFYLEPASLEIMKAVPTWRQSGLPVFYTVDAGANVHVLTQQNSAGIVIERLNQFPSVKSVCSARAGGAASLIIDQLK